MPFFSNPEEFMQHVKSQHERAQMESELFQVDINRLLREIGPDHLLTLRVIFNVLSTSDPSHGALMAAFLEGLASATLELQHKVCSRCGRDHEVNELDSRCAPITLGEKRA
jgi:hypothetical protein